MSFFFFLFGCALGFAFLMIGASAFVAWLALMGWRVVARRMLWK